MYTAMDLFSAVLWLESALVYRMYNIGDRGEPCGSPDEKGTDVSSCPLKAMSVRHSLTHDVSRLGIL